MYKKNFHIIKIHNLKKRNNIIYFNFCNIDIVKEINKLLNMMSNYIILF